MAIQEGRKYHDHKKDKGKAIIMLHGFHVAAGVGVMWSEYESIVLNLERREK